MKYITISLIMAATNIAYAGAPTKFNDCSSKIKIGGIPNSNGVFFDKDCSVAYVLPPKIGKLTIDAVNPYNQGLCPGHFATVDSYHEQILGLRNEMAGLTGVTDQNLPPASQRSCKRLERERAEISKKKTMLEINLSSKRGELDIAKESAKSCRGTCLYEKDLVTTIQYDINGLQSAFTKRSAELEDLESKLSDCQGKKTEVVANDPSTVQRQEEINVRMRKLNQELTTHYSSKTVGGDVVMIFETGQEELRSKYEATFGEQEVRFLNMPVEAALSFNLNYYDEDAVGVPVLKSDLPHFDKEIKIAGMSLTPDENYDSDYSAAHLNGAISGKVTLNVPTMCEVVKNQSTDTLGSFMTVNLFYKYGLQSTKTIDAEYEMKYVYEYFKSISKKGGFFRSRSSVEIRENTSTIKGINVRINNQDMGDSWGKEDYVLATEIRDWIVMKGLENVVDHSKTQLKPDVVGAPGNAASAASAGLSMCPHIYCMGAKVVLDVGNALFGSTSQSASYINRMNEKNTLHIESTKMLPQFGNTTFSIKGNR